MRNVPCEFAKTGGVLLDSFGLNTIVDEDIRSMFAKNRKNNKERDLQGTLDNSFSRQKRIMGLFNLQGNECIAFL
jgi:hypothetical protein